MNKWKKVLWKLLFPNKIIIFFLVNISAALLLYAFLGENCPEGLAYVSYAISAYALTVVCARMPEVVKRLKGFLHGNKYTGTYLREKELRLKISMYRGLIINIAFAIFKVVVGMMYQSKWLFAVAGYHTILSAMRFIMVRREQGRGKVETDEEKWIHGLQGYRVCGWFMLLLNIAISVIVAIVVVDNQAIDYPGFMIYAIAAFTFYCLTMAIINMVKYRRRANPIYSALKRIEMAKALVSIFTLQVAMITQFGGQGFDYRIANGATGLGVCLLINTMAAFMLAGVRNDYRESENNKLREKSSYRFWMNGNRNEGL